MTINSDISRARYVGNGVTTNFAIPFPYLTNNDGTAQIAVYLSDSDTPLVEGKDYTVTGFGKYSDYSEQVDEGLITYETRYEGGEVLLKVAPENQVPVAIIRNIPQTQGVVFVEGEEFPAQDFENALDKLTMQMQEVKENLQRSIWLPPTSTEKPIEIRDNILDAANEAEQVANEAIKLVEAAPAKIEEITNQAITEIGSATQNSIENINNTTEQSNEIILANVEKSRIWAEGEQAEVQELGGELSSMGAADLAYAIANAPEDTPIDASGLFAMNVVKGEKGDKGDKGDDGKDGGGLEIGDVAFAVMGIDETKNLRRYLNGQTISQAQFVSFTNWVKERANLYPNTVATEENWQAEVTNSKLGQCGKFVIDDTLGTIRLPKVVNIQGLQDLALMGSIKAESLPNISGTGLRGGQDGNPEGAFYKQNSSQSNANAGNYGSDYGFDASRSSSTYQDNAPVQQEAIQYPYFIQVATGVEESVDVTREIELNNPFFLGVSQYFESEPKNASWLISNGSFHSGAVYTSFYEWLLKIYNGTEIVEGVSVKASTEEYTDYDYVINTSETSFRLPIYDGSESLPSDKYEDLTLGASGDTYTAPANGWFVLQKTATGADQYIFMSCNRIKISSRAHAANDTLELFIPAVKDKPCTVAYTMGGATGNFRFIYAKGNGSLYYYVGETIQDANLINAGRALEALDGSSKLFDGQWIASGVEIFSSTAVGVYNIDLSEILPDDGYNYEILLNGRCYSSSSNYSTVTLTSGDFMQATLFHIGTNNRSIITNTTWIVDSSRQITIQIWEAKVESWYDPLSLVAYRRIGTNR